MGRRKGYRKPLPEPEETREGFLTLNDRLLRRDWNNIRWHTYADVRPRCQELLLFTHELARVLIDRRFPPGASGRESGAGFALSDFVQEPIGNPGDGLVKP